MRVYVLYWFVLAVVAFANGALRAVGYGPLVGEPWAHHLSVITGVSLITLAIWLFVRKRPFASRRQAALVGLLWLLMTEVFEAVMLLAWMRKSPGDFLEAHALLRGESWLVFLFCLTLAPSLLHRWQTRAQPNAIDDKTPLAREGLDAGGRKLLLSIFLLVVFHGVVLFVCAWDLRWRNAWLFLSLELTLFAAELGVLALANPSVLNARARRHENSEPFEKPILRIHVVLILSLFVLAGLDAGRFHWTQVSDSIRVVGLFLFLSGISLTTWTLVVNPFFEPTVRIQHERHHQVIQDGPYRWIRHPGYAAAIMLFFAYPLLLGSWLALFFSLAASTNFLVRIHLEEGTLRQKLEGYEAYTQKVRSRLIPGIW